MRNKLLEKILRDLEALDSIDPWVVDLVDNLFFEWKMLPLDTIRFINTLKLELVNRCEGDDEHVANAISLLRGQNEKLFKTMVSHIYPISQEAPLIPVDRKTEYSPEDSLTADNPQLHTIAQYCYEYSTNYVTEGANLDSVFNSLAHMTLGLICLATEFYTLTPQLCKELEHILHNTDAGLLHIREQKLKH